MDKPEEIVTGRAVPAGDLNVTGTHDPAEVAGGAIADADAAEESDATYAPLTLEDIRGAARHQRTAITEYLPFG